MHTENTNYGKITLLQEAYLDNRTPQYDEQLPCVYRALVMLEDGKKYIATWEIDMSQTEWEEWVNEHDGESPDFIEDGSWIDWEYIARLEETY